MTYKGNEQFECPYCGRMFNDIVESWFIGLDENHFYPWQCEECGNEFWMAKFDDNYEVKQ